MDSWKFFDITHKEHLICNPMSAAKIQRLVDLVRLPQNGRVLDIATGKGEFITRLIEQYGVSGVAVDLSPDHSRDARARFAARVPDADLTMLEMDAADYQPDEPESFDLTACLGASWIWHGHEGTLKALMGWTKPGGQIVVGEPFWKQEPSPEFLAHSEYERDMFNTHYGNAQIGIDLGLRLTHTIVSSADDWDNYYALYWYAADRYALAHPDDPDVPALLQKIREQQQEYLRWERNELGWAIYLFRKVE